VSDRLAVLPQYLYPKRALTVFGGFVASHRWGWITTRIIRRFIRKYRVAMDEALVSDPAQFATFNDFFTRALKPGARPLAQADFVCPVDGAISQLGAIERDQIFQAKGHSYSTTALLAGDATLAQRFENGSFATIYLSPRDYHRIHMPLDGRLVRMTYVPGDLFSVNPVTARGVPGLFARNERVICQFDTPHGPFVQVLVGATVVGSMATVWHGQVNPPRTAQVRQWDYAQQDIRLAQGEEMGRFLLGSTVVLLWPKDTIRFNPDWQAGGAVRLGQAMGKFAGAET
jgi:phosphatidylserine decarboxylase